MPPTVWDLPDILQPRHLNTTNPVTVSDYIAGQWQNPSDILSVLLLLGPEIVQGAIAQLSGRLVTPVAFSFGWVAYAVKTLLNAFGDGRLMPNTDMTNTLVIGAQSGHIRSAKTWILGRLLRDRDNALDEEMEGSEQRHVPPDATAPPQQTPGKDRPWEALRLTVYEVVPDAKHGVPTCDRVWFSGYATILVQLIISIIPWITRGEWDAFMITSCGNTLALIEGSLPQWKEEKWATPKKGGATVTITQGNGSRHAMVILQSKGVGLDFEILAQGTRTASASLFTRVSAAILALFWVALMITVSGLKSRTWYLLGIGLLGSMQNLYAAGAARAPSAMGIHIRRIGVFSGKRVAAVLKEAESHYEFVGTSLLPVFFQGGLRVKSPEDIEFWKAAMEKRLNPNKWGTRVDALPEKATFDEKTTLDDGVRFVADPSKSDQGKDEKKVMEASTCEIP